MLNSAVFKYVSASGVEVDFTVNPFVWRGTDLLNYAWTPAYSKRQSSFGSSVKNFARDSRQFTFQVLAINGTWAEITTALNRMHGIFEVDVTGKTPGKLYFGDQYLPGFITDSSKTVMDNLYSIVNLTFASGSPFWVTEDLHRFEPLSTSASTGFILPLALPFAIVAPQSRQMVNDHYVDCSAIITMYGPVTNPSFSIGSHTYEVTGVLNTGDRIEIDQVERTVTKISSSGERLNFFSKRGKSYSVFDPIPHGENYVYSNNDFTFDILLLKERSEPVWT